MPLDAAYFDLILRLLPSELVHGMGLGSSSGIITLSEATPFTALNSTTGPVPELLLQLL